MGRTRSKPVTRRPPEELEGGSLLDSSPMYGSSEDVLGWCLARLPAQTQTFRATKVWTMFQGWGVSQMQKSQKLWGGQRFDLIQIHNMLDWENHLETLKAWKAEGKVRYIGCSNLVSWQVVEAQWTSKERNLERYVSCQDEYSLLVRDIEKEKKTLAERIVYRALDQISDPDGLGIGSRRIGKLLVKGVGQMSTSRQPSRSSGKPSGRSEASPSELCPPGHWNGSGPSKAPLRDPLPRRARDRTRWRRPPRLKKILATG